MQRRDFLISCMALGAVSAAGAARATQAPPLTLPAAPIPGLTIAPELYPTIVSVSRDLQPGSIIVLSDKYFLYYIARSGTAIRYGVGVGRAELVFRGKAVVGAKKEWPTWKPTPEMVARNPARYGKWADKAMPGGPGNPLGARALYLFQNGNDTSIRIHGTIEPNSIGTSVSNGCIRMVNEHVIDLYDRVEIGTPVAVY